MGERQLKARVIDLPYRQDLLRVGATDDCKFLLPLHSQSLFQRFLGNHDVDHEQVVGTSAMFGGASDERQPGADFDKKTAAERRGRDSFRGKGEPAHWARMLLGGLWIGHRGGIGGSVAPISGRTIPPTAVKGG